MVIFLRKQRPKMNVKRRTVVTTSTRSTMILLSSAALLVLAATTWSGADAFTPTKTMSFLAKQQSCTVTPSRTTSRVVVAPLSMSTAAPEPEGDGEPSAEAEDIPSAEDDQEEVQPEEDPAITALKEQIATLESTLKSKQSSLRYAQDQAEEYSKAGYARKVAEMENMRRMRSVSST
jgi:hypothetical protein